MLRKKVHAIFSRDGFSLKFDAWYDRGAPLFFLSRVLNFFGGLKTPLVTQKLIHICVPDEISRCLGTTTRISTHKQKNQWGVFSEDFGLRRSPPFENHIGRKVRHYRQTTLDFGLCLRVSSLVSDLGGGVVGGIVIFAVRARNIT